MPDLITKVLKSFVLCLLSLTGFAYSGLYFEKGLYLSSSRADLIDVSAYHNVFDLLHTNLPAKIYDYRVQETNFKEIFEEPNESKIVEGFPYKTLYYYYPPISLPYAYLWSFGNAQSTFFLINFFSFFFLIFCLLLAFKECSFSLRKKTFILCLILLFSPYAHNVLHTQLSLIIALAVFLYYFYILKGQHCYSGIAQSITLIKPQTGIPLFISSLLSAKERESIIWCFLSCSVLSGLAYALIGFEGYKDYFVSQLQLFGVGNFDRFFPMPVPPTPLGNVYGLMCNFLSQDFVCKLQDRQIGLFTDKLLGLVALVYLVLQPKIFSTARLSDASKYFLSILILLLVSPYHHIHDYCLWIAALMIALTDENFAYLATAWFTSVTFILFLVDTLIGMNRAYLYFNLDISWLLNLVSVIVFSVIFFLKKDDINVSFTTLKSKLKVAKL